MTILSSLDNLLQVKLGNVKAAVDICILHNKWDQAIELAKEYDLPQISVLFKKYTSHLVERNMLANAVEINVQAKHFASAAELAFKLARQEGKRAQRNLIKVKKLFVYAALLASNDTSESYLHYMDNVWKGAEAYHYFLLAHELLYANKLRDAMNTAYKLQEYANYLDEIEIYKLLALIACQSQAFGVCSTAFIKLKSLEFTDNELTELNKLTYEIFLLHEPNDDDLRKKRCGTCHESLHEWSTSCPSCSSTFPTCIISGEPLPEKSQHWMCKVCHHVAQERYMNFRKYCPLCHALI